MAIRGVTGVEPGPRRRAAGARQLEERKRPRPAGPQSRMVFMLRIGHMSPHMVQVSSSAGVESFR